MSGTIRGGRAAERRPPHDGSGARPGKQKWPKPARLVAAAVFALVAVGVCSWSWQYYRKVYAMPKPPVPVLDLIPTVPKAYQSEVTSAVTVAAGMMFALSREQRAQVAEIWKDPPRTLEGLISRQKRMDQVMTPQQRERMKPMRRIVQGKIVDAMFEAGRNRFSPGDFEQMKNEIKRRVAERMDSE